jgi:hypothetical protein
LQARLHILFVQGGGQPVPEFLHPMQTKILDDGRVKFFLVREVLVEDRFAHPDRGRQFSRRCAPKPILGKQIKSGTDDLRAPLLAGHPVLGIVTFSSIR